MRRAVAHRYPPGVPQLQQMPGRAWSTTFVVVAASLVVMRFVTVPRLVEESVAVALGVLLSMGLSARVGGRPWWAATLAVVVGAAAVGTDWAFLDSGAALGVGIVAACLALMGTVPAPTTPSVVREVVGAELVATAGGLGVAVLGHDLDVSRFTYLVLAVSLVGAIALVYRLGAGLHGLGRAGAVAALLGVVFLAGVVAYAEVLARYGSPEMVGQVEQMVAWMQEHLGGVPRPMEALLGVPALAWGVSIRSRRRQGWWLCAFGAATTAPATTRLLGHGAGDWTSVTLSAVYGVVIGLVLGFVLIRIGLALARTPGRRVVGALAPRPEPARLRSLH